MSERSPGPWVVEAYVERPECLAICSQRDGVLAIIEPQPDAKKVDEKDLANALVMAAGLDLLTAAKEIDRLSLVIESAVRNQDPFYRPQVVAALSALALAISNAEGAR